VNIGTGTAVFAVKNRPFTVSNIVTVHGVGRGRRRFSAKCIAMMEYLVPKTSSVPVDFDP
jgi:hypothetical protein